jgi:hypothetical protein
MMQRVVRRRDVAVCWARARLQFADQAAEIARLCAERDELLATLNELRNAVHQRWKAEAEIAELHRQRAMLDAFGAEPGGRLH